MQILFTDSGVRGVDSLELMDKEQKARLKRRVTIALIVLPVVIASFVVGGVFLGFYVGDILGFKRSVIMPLAFSTIGLLISLIVSYSVAKKAATV